MKFTAKQIEQKIADYEKKQYRLELNAGTREGLIEYLSNLEFDEYGELSLDSYIKSYMSAPELLMGHRINL